MFISAFLACFDLVLFRQCFFQGLGELLVCLPQVSKYLSFFCSFLWLLLLFQPVHCELCTSLFLKCQWQRTIPFSENVCFFSLGCQSLFEDCLLGILAS